jgi:hypothetical protein
VGRFCALISFEIIQEKTENKCNPDKRHMVVINSVKVLLHHGCMRNRNPAENAINNGKRNEVK